MFADPTIMYSSSTASFQENIEINTYVYIYIIARNLELNCLVRMCINRLDMTLLILERDLREI